MIIVIVTLVGTYAPAVFVYTIHPVNHGDGGTVEHTQTHAL